MKIKAKKIISLILVMLILISHSPISLAMGEDTFKNNTEETGSIETTKEKKPVKCFLDEVENKENSESILELESNDNSIEDSMEKISEDKVNFPETYSCVNDEFEVLIKVNPESLQEDLDLIVEEIDSDTEHEQLDLYSRITDLISKKINENEQLDKVKAYDIYFINESGDKIKDIDIIDVNYSFKKPLSFGEESDISLFSIFDDELIDCRNVEIKKNDDGEITELSFEVEKIEQLALFNRVEKVATLEESEEEKESNKPNLEILKEFDLNYSDYEKSIVSNFKNFVEDRSNEELLNYNEILDFKNSFDINYGTEGASAYVEIEKIDIKDGYFLINFKNTSGNSINNIRLKYEDQLSLEEEIYSEEEIETARGILKQFEVLDESIALFNNNTQEVVENNLDTEVKNLFENKQEMIQSLEKIEPLYSLKNQGLDKVAQDGPYENDKENILITPTESNYTSDFSLGFKVMDDDISTLDLMEISVEGDFGNQVIRFVNNKYIENDIEKEITPRSLRYVPMNNTAKKEPNIEKHKTIDYLGDGTKNPDTDIQDIKTPEEIADSYRIYLDLNSESQVERNGVDLVIVLDRSGSMDKRDMRIPGSLGPKSRVEAIDYFLNGPRNDSGFIHKFLEQNQKNNLSIVDFGGVGGALGNNRYELNKDSKILLDWTSNPKTVRFRNGYNEGTNYDAGLIRAEQQFKKKSASSNKKVMLFLSDGVPTFFVNDSGERRGNGIYSDSYNVRTVRERMLNGNLQRFYNANPDVSTIAVGVSRDINSTDLNSSTSPEVLKKMAEISGGRFLGIEENIEDLTAQLSTEILFAVSQVKVTDTLSSYVKLDSKPDFKVTVTDNYGTIKTIWENGQTTALNENGKYINSVETKIRNGEESVILNFNPDYKLEKKLKFTLSYNVTIPRETFEEYQRNGYPHKGDFGTDYPGNTTSSGKAGFRSNKEAYVDYVFGPEEKPYKEYYDHPVVQVELQHISIKKVDQAGNPLRGAKFSIYEENPENNPQALPLQLYGNSSLSGQLITEFTTDEQGHVNAYGLVHGEYYLKEVQAPSGGYLEIEDSLNFEITRLGKIKFKGNNNPNFSLIENTSGSTIKVKNEIQGYILPDTGGSGTIHIRAIGLLFIIPAIIYTFKKRYSLCKE